MLFSIQSFLEDYFAGRNWRDSDGYAVNLANVYFHQRSSSSSASVLKGFGQIRTVFFENNDAGSRREFEKEILKRLDNRFKKKLKKLIRIGFPGGVDLPRERWQNSNKKTIRLLLTDFKSAIESSAIDSFWSSRKKGKLKPKPESIAQGLLAIYCKGVIGRNGYVLREVLSGVGYVDLVVILARTMHLVEMKVIGNQLKGVVQLEDYMRKENRRKGYLVLIDTVGSRRKTKIPDTIPTLSGKITIIRIDINPLAPSKK